MGLMAGYGLQPWPILQDLSQFRDLYGARANTFVANAGVLQVFGVNDVETACWLSQALGKALIGYETNTHRPGDMPSTSEHVTGRELLTRVDRPAATRPRARSACTRARAAPPRARASRQAPALQVSHRAEGGDRLGTGLEVELRVAAGAPPPHRRRWRSPCPLGFGLRLRLPAAEARGRRRLAGVGLLGPRPGKRRRSRAHSAGSKSSRASAKPRSARSFMVMPPSRFSRPP